jgi:hypothetical protein
MIFVTGDVHGEMGMDKFNMKNFPQQKFLTKDDCMIVCGDFGLIWDNSKQEKHWQKWISERNFTILFVDGNHENHDMLNQYPVEFWNGGKVHHISDSIIHLMRGQVFNIDNKKIFTFGGANSTDKAHRINKISWWEDEMPSYSEMSEGLDNLEKHNWEVDYILTHNCCSSTLSKIDTIPRIYNSDCLNNYLETIESMVSYKHWYFGHFHFNEMISEKQTVLYRKIIELGGHIDGK